MISHRKGENMYATNGKISNRQTFRLYVFDLMGLGTLLLPPYLAKLCGIDGIWAIVIGSALGFLYLAYLNWVVKKMGCDVVSFLKASKNEVLSKLIFGLVGFHSLFTAGFCVYVFASLMLHSLIQEVSFGIIALVLVLSSCYAVGGGIESRARVYEILFYFILIPYVAMMTASVKGVKPEYLGNLFSVEAGNLGKGIYLVFLLLMPLFYSIFLIREKEKKKTKGGFFVIAGALLFTSIILLGSYVLLLGNFGSKALGDMRFPIISLMSTVQFQGNFLKRMDALMVAVWFFTLFALLNLHLHYGVNMGRELLGLKENKKEGEEKMTKQINNRRRIILWLGVGLSVFLLAYGFQIVEGAKQLFIDYYSYVATPVMVVLPGLLVLSGESCKEGTNKREEAIRK